MPTSVRALINAALELGQTAQDGEHQPAMRRGGVGPAVVQALETTRPCRRAHAGC
jgi:hypothetical protein